MQNNLHIGTASGGKVFIEYQIMFVAVSDNGCFTGGGMILFGCGKLTSLKKR